MNIKSLLESRLREYDLTLDLTEGSFLQRTVISPVVDALGSDPMSVGTREYLYAKFTELFPDSAISRGNALDDILISACELFFEGYRRELEQLKSASSISNISLLSDDEADALASNWFLSRNVGSKSAGTVTVTVDRAVSVIIDTLSVRFFSSDGTEFTPTVGTSINVDALLGNVVSPGRYQFNVNVRSNVEGAAGNVGAGRIVRVIGIPNVVSVTNAASLLGGSERDTSEYLLETRLPRAISERSLITARGIGARVTSSVAGILRYQVIGFGETEMIRDLVEADSYGDLIASGFAHYMGTHALITGFTHTGKSIASNDELLGLTTNLSNRKNTITQIVASISGSIIFGPTSFTMLVELKDNVVDTQLDHISILRPRSALLDSTVVSNQVGIGGRVDVYLRGDRLQDVAGSAIFNPDEYLVSGTSWVGSGSTVTIYRETPFVGDEILEFDFLVVGEECRTISSADFTVPPSADGHAGVGLTLYTDLPADMLEGIQWSTVRDLTFNTGAATRIIAPIAGGSLNVTCSIGSNEVFVVGQDLVAAGAQNGDVLSIPSIGFAQSILALSDHATILLESGASQTLASLPAEVLRPISKMISPILELDAPTSVPRHPISIDVNSIRGEVPANIVGVGNILPPIGRAISTIIDSNIDTVFANIPDSVTEFIGFRTISETGGATLNGAAPLSRGYADPQFGQFSFLVTHENVLTDSDSHTTQLVYELRLWCDILTSNARNIFVMRGDGVSSDQHLPYPGEGVSGGDILRISSGHLAGDYIIESVIHNDLILAPTELIHAISDVLIDTHIAEQPATGYETMRRIRSDTYTTPVGEKDLKQRISLVRIHGQFPESPVYALAEFIEILAVSLVTGAGATPREINALYAESIIAYLNGLDTMFSSTLDANILSRMATGAGAHPMMGGCTPIDWVASADPLKNLFSASVHADYEIIKPSRSTGSIKLRHEGGSVYLAKPSVSDLDIDDILSEMQLGQVPRAFIERPYSEITGSVGTYHLDPTYIYYVGGNDYKNWGVLGTPEIVNSVSTTLSEYTLRDNYSPTSTQLPINGPSCIDHRYMRDDVVLIRYQELEMSASVSGLSSTPTHANYYVFGCPVLPGYPSSTQQSTVEINIQSDPQFSEDMVYAIRGESEHDDIIAAIGVARDGTDGLLVDIYNSYGALIYTQDLAVATILVAAYNSIVTVLSPDVNIPDADEFAMPSLLPNTGQTIALGSSRGTHISVGEVSTRTDKITLVPACPLVTTTSVTVGRLLRVSYKDNVEWRRVSSVSGMDVHLNEPISSGTPEIKNYGICVVDTATGDIFQVSDPISGSGVSALDSMDTEIPTTHLHTGGSLRPIVLEDVGRHITLWGYNVTEVNHGDALLSPGAQDVPVTQADFEASLLAPERKTFGQFEITSVTPTYSTSTIITSIAEEYVKVRVSGGLLDSVSSDQIESLAPTHVLCNFAITDATLDLEEGVVNNVVEVTMYNGDPQEYPVVGRHKSDASRYLIQPPGSTLYTYGDVSGGNNDVFNAKVLITHAELEPCTFQLDNVISVEEDQELWVATTRAQSSVFAESMHVDGLSGTGYESAPVDSGLSKSNREDISLRVAPTDGPIPTTVSVNGYFDGVVGQAQSLLSSPSERAICADGLAKTLHSGYLGIEATYTGGPSIEDAESAVAAKIKSLLLTDNAINESIIISTLMGMGAVDVQTPVNLYVCYEDNMRRVHKRRVNNYLTQASLFKSDVTLRTLYVGLAPPEGRRLGASIDFTRNQVNFNTIGTGGA